MLDWLRPMCHPDGEISFFNDAAFKIAARPMALEQYAMRLGMSVSLPEGVPIKYLPESGYVSARLGPFALIFDAARVGPSYLPAHAHADTLSFELSWRQQRLICNSGTSCYGTGAQRAWERSTAAHNTVVVDDQDSSEVWHGFRVARRAKPFDLSYRDTEGALHLTCAHDGYRRLTGRPVHRRELVITEKEVSWCDEISGHGTHEAVGNIPIHPDVQVSAMKRNAWQLRCPDGMRLELASLDGLELALDTGTYAPEFGRVIKRPVLKWTLAGQLPIAARICLRQL
jgi:uncharacterized heparinase superfamily protein